MNVFDPVDYSVQENEFLLKHLGEPPVVALKEIKAERLPNANPKDTKPFYYPDGVIPASVRPIIERVYELTELEKHAGAVWVGLDALKDKIKVYLEQSEKWATDKRRGAPRFPSMSSFDSKGKPHRSGPGSDNGKVRTYFAPDGTRIPFAIELLPEGGTAWEPDWKPEQKVKIGIVNNVEMNRIECLTCGHTESYNADSRGSYNAARARMSKHLRTSNEEVSAHREAHTNEFGS